MESVSEFNGDKYQVVCNKQNMPLKLNKDENTYMLDFEVAGEVDKSSNGSMSAPTTTVFSNNVGDIMFTGTGTGVNIVITNSGGPTVNPNLHLVNEPGRFIAEFSIVSRE